jgi:GNAT superfamily N-acetyltransferase
VSATVEHAVRAAVPSDAEALGWLHDMARVAAVDMRGGPRWLEETPRIDDWSAALADPALAVFAGTLDDVVLGLLVLEFDHAGDVATVQLAYVHPEARELGLGDDLLALAIGEARHRGARLFEGVALPGDRDTKNLYERAGITARKLVVSTQL